jgi:hypothetical protein
VGGELDDEQVDGAWRVSVGDVLVAAVTAVAEDVRQQLEGVDEVEGIGAPYQHVALAHWCEADLGRVAHDVDSGESSGSAWPAVAAMAS